LPFSWKLKYADKNQDIQVTRKVKKKNVTGF